MAPGLRLRLLRRRAGLNQAEAAEIIGCHQTLVGAIERGAKRPGLNTALGIERLTSGIKGGPIRVIAWASAPAARQARTVEGVTP